MLPKVRLGRTGLEVTRIGMGGFPIAGVNKARGWDPYTPEGRATAIATVRAALDAGINYVDTAPVYGDGHSESIIGEATEGRRDEFVLASKIYFNGTGEDVKRCVEGSLKRLRTDVIDIIQFHGGMYSPQEVDKIVNGGLLDATFELRDEGKIRFVGFTTEEAWTGRALIATGQFDLVQVKYNLIHQAAAIHLLDEAKEADMGVAIMRPLTSGILQRLVEYIAPKWQEAHDIYEVALKYVLSDSRVHVANLGMRWPEEVAKNVALAESFKPEFDMADLPRGMAPIYKTDDEMHGAV